jgi:hypothetical protein
VLHGMACERFVESANDRTHRRAVGFDRGDVGDIF